MMNLLSLSFAYPLVLLVLLVIPLMVVFQIRKKSRTGRFMFSVEMKYEKMPQSFRQKTKWLPDLFFYLALSFVILALARPQGGFENDPNSGEGIDIVLALDVSSSMLSRDLDPDRLKAAKDIAIKFVKGRPNDRIGLVIFAAESYTLCPLTLDHDMFIKQLKVAEPGFLEDGTAIGDGLGLAVARIKDSKNPSKVIVLLSDGVSTRNTITPEAAADEAQKNNITVYTIGVGTMGMALMPITKYANNVYDFAQAQVNIDEEVLKMVAAKTKGKYFRATDNESLEEIFSDIDLMEKAKIEDVKIIAKPDVYAKFLWVALASYFIYVLLNFTWYQKAE